MSSYTLTRDEDGIFHVAFFGDTTLETVEAYVAELGAMIDALEEESYYLLVNAQHEGKFSGSARRALSKVDLFSKKGVVAVCNPKLFSRVMATFIMKATGQYHIRFFESEAEALNWLKSHPEIHD